uniref:DExD/H-box helicase 60 n=1 Tax=Varanus komodoensis TaxID=61221 RepID=A0A8D2JCL2_VARKO
TDLEICMRDITCSILNCEIPSAECVSLLNDYVESEFFLIDGDSLFITCARELTLQQGQSLHFFYLVERFLLDLTSKGAKYIIVFFKDAEHLYYRNPGLLSWRTALIIHLRKNTGIEIHTEFSNCLDSSWKTFLDEHYPYFVIISDEGLNELQTNFLHIFIMHTLSKQINVVLTSGQKSDTIRVYGYHIRSKYKHQHFFQKMKNGKPSKVFFPNVICRPFHNIFFFCLSKGNVETALTLQEAGDLIRMYCLSVVFLQHVPLSQRAQIRDIDVCWKKEHKLCECHVLEHLVTQTSWNVDLSALPDLSDDLLWRNIAFYFEAEKSSGAIMKRDYELLWSLITALSETCNIGTSFPLRTASNSFLEKKCSPTTANASKMTFLNPGLIPIKNAVVDEFAGDILTGLPFLKSNDSAITSLKKQKEFDELLHWHSGRPLSDDYDRTKEFYKARKDPQLFILQQKQKFLRFQRFYGQSLEGNLSRTIVTQSERPKKAYANAKKSKKIQKTKAEIIIEENQKRKRTEEEKKEEHRWGTLSVMIEASIKEDMASGIQHLEEFLKNCQSASVKCSAEMAALTLCFGLWTEHFAIANLWSVEFMSLLINGKGRDMIAIAFLIYIIEDGRKDLKSKHSKYAVGMGSSRFQLKCMGHYLIREEREDPDPRVKHFIPDTWQRELLDIVDNKESAVIVAATSSGKTYASYYCMEKILSEDNEGVVVYVAPTKALVNQVSAVIYNRFNKVLPAGLSLCGVFTRDYRHDALNSQILVTVPQCLEILLLSPHRQAWAEKIRYVIFDEVHCLGGEIGAEVWEHLLVMIRCPFLALSATISNPKHLVEWLQSVKRYWQYTESVLAQDPGLSTTVKKRAKVTRSSQSYKVKLVQYGERYNDLEKYVCSPSGGDFMIHHYHPCAALTLDHLERYGFPLDLSLSPRETVMLYDAMVNAWTNWPRANELDPEEFLKDKVVITKADARNYEKEMKEELKMWIKCGNSDKAKKVLSLLKPRPTQFIQMIERLWYVQMLWITTLMMKDYWPCCLGLLGCKDGWIGVADNKSILLYSDFKRTHKEDQKMVWEAELGILKTLLDKISKIPADCTYANEKAIDNEFLDQIFHRARFLRKHSMLKKLALRGIGYHHASVEQKGRQMVEMLFRKGFIQVVTATGTLALGVNMPCKSVVFVRNSVYLDALNYRQMSGRAGRRGQDLLGNVYFYDIPLPKIEKLIKSNVPELRGQFPLGISLILRLMLLASKADNKADAKAKVLSILKHSLLSFKHPRKLEMLKLYFLFSLQFLVKEGYLDQCGNTTGFSGLVTHLHYHEPSNIILVEFLVKGLFHKLCQPIKQGSKVFSEDVMEKLVLVLAHLFGRRTLPAAILKSTRKFYQSKVFLEDLPEDFAAALKEYNCKIEENFGQFLQIVSALADMKQEYQLPLSELDFSSKEQPDSQLASHLMSCDTGRTAVSPFVCLSGNSEIDLQHARTINSVLLRTIGITGANIPVLPLKQYDNQGRRMPINAYLLDFYKHGSLVAMNQDNGIHEGEAYVLLKDFCLVLQAISVSLREICDNEDDHVVQAFEQLSEIFWEKLNKV